MAVPPEIALQIDEGVKQDPTFPDTLLKSIYPGKFGSDKHQYLKRNQANEIMFLDLTKDPNDPGRSVQLTEPIPY